MWWVYLFEFHFIDCFHCLSEFRKEFAVCILQATKSCPVYDKRRGESLKHLKILWNLNNLLEFRKKTTTSSLKMNLHFWWEKIMLHVSTSLFQWVVRLSIHRLSPNKCPYWSSAFQIEESITQYFCNKFCSKFNTSLRKTSKSWLRDFKWRIREEKNQTQTPKIISSFSSSWRQILQAVQPLCTAWTDIFTLLTWTAHEREGGARANSESLYLSFTAYLPLLAANVLQRPQIPSLTSLSHHSNHLTCPYPPSRGHIHPC